MFTHILVAMDFSPPSDAALDYARALATRFDARLHLLHVVEDPMRAVYSAEVFVPEVEGLRDSALERATASLRERLGASDAGAVHASVAALIGTPAYSIVEYAAAHDIDLIVMGTHGRGGMSHLLMGSVAERVVRSAACPVLTVHAPAKPAVRAA